MENGKGQNNNFPSWDYWELLNSGNPTRLSDWNGYQASFAGNEEMLMGNTHPLYPSEPHLTCLKLGKRQYCEDGGAVAAGKRKRGVEYDHTSSSVPRCKVEGCHVALSNAKDYHKRHKVCEMHSKAPKVIVLGIEQRFCQQCSRFHVISEFDESKRSCRRRLAGHNERRRKSSNESIISNTSQENKMMDDRFSCISSTTGRALSLLSSKTSWVSSLDLSPHSSAALHELIAENRATVLAGQLLSDRGWQHLMDDVGGSQTPSSLISHHHQVVPDGPDPCRLLSGLNHFHEPAVHVTLDLMQDPNSSFEIFSGSSKMKEEEEEGCCEIWKSLTGSRVV